MSKTSTNPESINAVDNAVSTDVMTIKAVRVTPKSSTESLGYNVQITFDKTFECYKLNQVTKLYERSQTNIYQVSVGIMTAMLSDLSDKLALLMSVPISAVVCKEGMTDIQKVAFLLAMLLVGSKVTMLSEEHKAGEVIGDNAPLTRDQIFHDITKFDLSERAKAIIERKAEEILVF